jgi:hypothetical protein
MQAITVNEFGDLAEARQAIRHSFVIQEFQPRAQERWEEAHQRFMKL